MESAHNPFIDCWMEASVPGSPGRQRLQFKTLWGGLGRKMRPSGRVPVAESGKSTSGFLSRSQEGMIETQAVHNLVVFISRGLDLGFREGFRVSAFEVDDTAACLVEEWVRDDVVERVVVVGMRNRLAYGKVQA